MGGGGLLVVAIAFAWWRGVYASLSSPDPAGEAAVLLACRDRLLMPHALETEGLFRVPGSKVDIDRLLTMAKGGKHPGFAAAVASADVATAASLLKAQLRLRATPLLYPAISVLQQLASASRPTAGDAVMARVYGAAEDGVLADGGTGTIVRDDLKRNDYEVMGADGRRSRYAAGAVVKVLRGNQDDVASWGVEGITKALLGDEQHETAKLIIAMLVRVVEEPANRMDALSLVTCLTPTLLYRHSAADLAKARAAPDVGAAARALAAKSSSAAEGLAALLRAIVDAKARANPAAWRRHVAPSGGAFYVYVATGETSWSLPQTVSDCDVEDGDADILIEE
jgi:hypothetical protein